MDGIKTAIMSLTFTIRKDDMVSVSSWGESQCDDFLDGQRMALDANAKIKLKDLLADIGSRTIFYKARAWELNNNKFTVEIEVSLRDKPEPVETIKLPSNWTHNERIYRHYIESFIPNINPDDIKWLCNQSAKAYNKIDDGCIDNYRVCFSNNGSKTVAYMDALAEGCCGFYDDLVTNAYTGNSYWIGFNYGH